MRHKQQLTMRRTIEQIKNYIQLHTSDMENDEYVELMREIAVWAGDQADLQEYRDEPEEWENGE